MATRRGALFKDTPKLAPTPDPAPDTGAKSRGKMLGFYVNEAAHRQLRQIAAEEGSSNDKLLKEALNMLFNARRKPEIA